MAASKLDLPEDLLLSSNLPDGAARTAGKDALAGGNNEDKALLGLVDESKDQMAFENSIPLSPQWLYAKPTESKPGLSTAAGETRSGNLSALGTLPDSSQKEVWRLDGSQDKKERRSNVPDVESNCSWREEERETSLLGRRERKKDDRESEYRKNERRPDNVSARETNDSRSLPSSDRWIEVPNRTVGNESRRDSKWSSRWGPDEKDKDSRTEKKLDAVKEDSHVEKLSFIPRPLTDTDSRDKWRPRHRQEVNSGGSSSYRAAPGFGLERGRVEGSTVGFALGRGRSNSIPGLSRPSATPIGAEPVPGKSVLSFGTFRYPRAKLLDIYRKQKVSLFDNTPDGLEEVPPITESSFVTPLAFVTPDAEEEVLLGNIWKGKVTSSEASYNLDRERIAKTNDHGTGAGNNMRNEREQDLDFDIGETKDKATITNDAMSDGSTPTTVDLGVCLDIKASSGNRIIPGFDSDDLKIVSGDENLDMRENGNTGEASGIFFEVGAKLPDDANDLFDASVVEQFSDTRNHEKNLITKTYEQGTSPEELSLFYQDPQGMVQGPFLGLDIISWFEDGFFGLDLPVCLSDAPEGTSFQPLGEVMPHLKLKLQSFPDVNPNKGSEQLDTLSTITEGNNASDVTSSFVTNNQQMGTPFNGLEHLLKHNVAENETPIIPQQDRIPFSIPERQMVSPLEGQNYHDFSTQDSEGKALSNLEKQLGNPGDEFINIPGSSSDQHYEMMEAGNNNLSLQSIARDSDLNPLGLLWSELKGNHHKHPLSSTIPSIANKTIMDNAAVTNPSAFLQKHEQINAIKDLPNAGDVWSNNFRHSDSNIIHDVLDHSQLSHIEFEPNQFNLDEHLILQQIQKEQHQNKQRPHQNLEFTGPFSNQTRGSMSHEHPHNQSLPELEHLLNLQFEQKLHFEQMQQQLQLQQQQQNFRQQHMQLLRQQQHQQQQQQQQQQRQQIIEQLLHQQLHDRGFGALNVDPRHVNNMVDEVLLRQQLLQESQQPHHLPLHHDPAIDQIIQAKYGHSLNRENQYDILDAISHSKPRQMLPFEQQFLLGLQQEQLQARQFSTSRQQPVMDEERHIGGLWSVDESGQFIRTAASPHQSHLARGSQLDVMQPPHRPSSFEQPSQLERNFLLHERMQQAQYEKSLHDLERLSSLHAGPPGSQMEIANALSHLHGLGGHEHQNLHSASQIAQFSSNVRPHHRPTTDEFNGMHRDEMEQSFFDRNEHMASHIMESHFNRLQLDADKKMKSMQPNAPIEDPHLWASQLVNDGSSGHGLQEYLHQTMLQSHQPSGLLSGPPAPSIENRDSSWLYSQPGDGYSFNPRSDRLGLNNSGEDAASLFPKSEQSLSESLMNANLEGHGNAFDGSGRLPFRSSSATLFDQNQLLSDIDRIERQELINSMSGDASMEGYVRELRMGNMQGLKGLSRGRSAVEMLEGNRHVSVRENEELKFNPPSRHASSGSISSGGGVNFYFGMGDNPTNEESVNNRVSNDPVKMHIVSSQPGVPDMISSHPPKGKNPSISASFENKREMGSNQVVLQSGEAPSSNKKDLRFRRTSSISDVDVSEPTFIDMLKSTKKSIPEGDAPDTGVNKGSKKKGKKGRQIDPSLLGFKVHSNRILMGEIHRPDD